MKKVIMITGDLAALKSTIAARLGKDLNILVLCKDKIKEILGDTIGFTNREENLKLSAATFKLIAESMLQTLEVNESVIIESNFRNFEIDEIKKRCYDNNYELIVIFLSGDPTVLYQRYLDRQKDRHRVHTSTGTIEFESFKSIMKPFDPLLYGAKAIVIDTTSFEEEEYQLLLKQIRMRIQTK